MSFVNFLAGMALGAAGAALFEEGRQRGYLGAPWPEEWEDEEGNPNGPGVVVGPPGGVSSSPPSIGPTVSVEPEVQAGSGTSFFGLSAPLWLWPWAFRGAPSFGRPLRLICKRGTEDDREILRCREERPLYLVAYGPPASFL